MAGGKVSGKEVGDGMRDPNPNPTPERAGGGGLITPTPFGPVDTRERGRLGLQVVSLP